MCDLIDLSFESDMSCKPSYISPISSFDPFYQDDFLVNCYGTKLQKSSKFEVYISASSPNLFNNEIPEQYSPQQLPKRKSRLSVHISLIEN